jgi:hypothetical protein
MSRDICLRCPDTSQRVSEGTRTPDRLDHNQELYQLSYAHQGFATGKSSGESALVSTLTGELPFRQGEALARGQLGAPRGEGPPGLEQPAGILAEQ